MKISLNITHHKGQIQWKLNRKKCSFVFLYNICYNTIMQVYTERLKRADN